MISRVAESCFWLMRQVERADSTARLLKVHSGMVLDFALPPSRTWRPLLIVLGEEARFLELEGARAAEDGERVQEYLTWDARNPVSILSALRNAREGARTIRETLSLEMWSSLNATWLWLRDGRGRRLFQRERNAFYEELLDRFHLFHGACQNTMLHEAPFDFMRLGLNLERAQQTARVIDLQHHALGPGGNGNGRDGAVEAVEWIAILRACRGYEPYFKKRVASLQGPRVTEFLLQEATFPGSVRHALLRATNFLERVRPPGDSPIGERARQLLRDELQFVDSITPDDILSRGIHDLVTEIVDRTSEVCSAVIEDYFAPSLPGDTGGLSSSPQASEA